MLIIQRRCVTLKKINGVLTALVTPFTESDLVDEEGLGILIERQIEAGIHGICVTAGSGEFVNLTDDERERVVELSVNFAKGRIPVVAGVFAANTKDAVACAKRAENKGADALLLLTPYYNRPSDDGLKLYYKTVAESVNTPLIVYNNPGRTGIDVSNIYESFADIKNIIGVKECNRDMGTFTFTVQNMGKYWNSILSGDEDIFYPTLCLGGKGSVLTTSNVAPDRWVKLYNAFLNGDHKTACEVHFEMMALIYALYTKNHPALVKKCLRMLGLPAGKTRSPLVEPTEAQVARISELIEKMNLK
jgi:4-hydroxy-tetrahydrodipicolinate synthase